MNSIHVIRPVLRDGVLAFDDPARGLLREPFVAGADVIILEAARLAGKEPESGVTLLFSASRFPGASVALGREHESGGRWYDVGGVQGWLCPALMKYFDAPPDEIWFRVG